MNGEIYPAEEVNDTGKAENPWAKCKETEMVVSWREVCAFVAVGLCCT